MTRGSDRNAESFAANEALWDAWTAVHSTGDFYDLDAFRAGGVRLRPLRDRARRRGGRPVAAPPPVPLRDRHAVVGAARGARDRRGLLTGRGRAGAVAGRSSSASPRRASSGRTCTTCPTSSTGPFDVVYTSRGVLGWLPDIRGWAQVVAHFLAPGGRFFITEIHPVAQVFENEGVAAGELRLRLPVLGARGAAHLRGARARTPTRPPTSASRPSTAGTTASARSSPR